MAIKYYVGDRSSGLQSEGKPTGVLSGHLHGETDTGNMFLYTGTGWTQASGADVSWTDITGNQTDINLSGFTNDMVISDFTNDSGYITGVEWDEITGNQSLVNISGFNNDSGFITGVAWDEITGLQTDINLSGFTNDMVVSDFTNDVGYITGVAWDEITGDQSLVDLSGFNNDSGFITGVSWTEITGTQSDINVSGFTNDADYVSGTAGTDGNLVEWDTGGDIVDSGVATSDVSNLVTNISVTQAVDLDAIESRVNELDASVVLSGTWDASSGSFPTASNTGESFIVSTGGTVDGVEFVANDRIVAITDSPSTTTYASNWHKLDYTDAVLSVDGQTGAVTLDYIDSVTAGTGLTGGGTSGAVTVDFDLSSLTDHSASLVAADQLAIYDTSAGTNRRTTFSDIPLSILNDDLGVVTGAAGSDGHVQFNSSGDFGASANFDWDNANQLLGITGFMRLKEGGTVATPAHDEATYYVETEAIGTTDTVTRVMMRRGDGQDVIVSSYIN